MSPSRFPFLALPALIVLPLADACGQPILQPSGYRSPYAVHFTISLKELTGNLEKGSRGDPHLASTIPFREWYSKDVRERYGPWGPTARHFAPPEGLAQRSLEWKQQRLLAVALRFQGYDYQHHHLPDWNPPADWPWKPVKSGHNGKGVDCSNFTAFVYNLALGLKPNSNVKKQAELLEIAGPGPKEITRAERIEKPSTYAQLVQTLRTGDLLFIRNKEKQISHVVFWVGSIGQAPDQTPLILDSHGDGVKDANGQSIPAGVQLRPFRERSWYFQSASHALRFLRAK